jgi:hypothetical protein
MKILRSFSVFEFLKALHAVENPANSHEPGKHGELGKYQMCEATWKRYTALDFCDANVWAFEDSVALKHVRRIEGLLAKQGARVDAFNVALCWNAGEHAVGFSASTINYAERVRNTYDNAD